MRYGLDRYTVRIVQTREGTLKDTRRKKTYNLDVETLEKARRLLQAKTETEAIERALQKVIEDREIQESLDRLLKEGKFRTIYR